MSPSDVAPGPSQVATLRDRASLTAEVLVTYPMVRWSVRRHDLPSAVAALRAPRRRHTPAGRWTPTSAAWPPPPCASSSGSPATRAASRDRWSSWHAARRGIDVRLVLAARPTPTFAAHAWVERGGRPLLPDARFRGRSPRGALTPRALRPHEELVLLAAGTTARRRADAGRAGRSVLRQVAWEALLAELAPSGWCRCSAGAPRARGRARSARVRRCRPGRDRGARHAAALMELTTLRVAPHSRRPGSRTSR